MYYERSQGKSRFTGDRLQDEDCNNRGSTSVLHLVEPTRDLTAHVTYVQSIDVVLWFKRMQSSGNSK